jgi:organic radical activating enzyme
LGGDITLRALSDKRGDELVRGILVIVDKHKPLQVTLVGGEPMVRHRELGRILPVLSGRGIHTMVVTSGVIAIPEEWAHLSNFTIAVSVDGLPEHHDVRRQPATYDRILSNMAGHQVNIHWTITAQMLEREGYLEEYVRFWSRRKEARSIWVSLYSPQRGEDSPERLSPKMRNYVTHQLSRLSRLYPKLLTPDGYAQALLRPPASPRACTFSRLSKNCSADLKTQVEPCVFGGDPDCAQCGCSASAAAHWISEMRLAGPLKAKHVLHASMQVGNAMARLQRAVRPSWQERKNPELHSRDLVQISAD